MLNTTGFNTRLQEILNYYGFSASAFAEKIGIARSSISHIVSGRNKPSLEFVLNILENFEDVEFDWLMYGNGNFPKKEKQHNTSTSSDEKKEINQTSLFKKENVNENNSDLFLNTSNNMELKKDNGAIEKGNYEEEIERVIIFYKNGSFKEYKN